MSLDESDQTPAVPAVRNVRLPADDLSWEDVRAALAGTFAIRDAGSSSGMLTIYDTFEWGVWFSGLVLWEQGGVLRLSERENDWIGAEQASLELTGRVPPLGGDFPDSPLARMLRPRLGLRALRPVGRVVMERHCVELLDENRKTVLRLDIQDLRGAVGPGRLVVQVRPLRGYEDAAARATEILGRLAVGPLVEGPFDACFREHGTEPRIYTLRPTFDLAAELPAREAVRHIVQKVLAIARENEPGIIDDIDTEFLHDARICVRKIRSVLSLVKGVYPDEETRRLKDTFSRLGRITNRLRDLDVQLLDRAEDLAQLPPDFRDGLDGMFADFAAERAEEHRRVAAHFRSSEYQRERDALERFFTETDGLAESGTSAHPIGPLVTAQIYRRYRKMRKLGRKLGPDTPDEAIHRLRVQGKKLRYLLEFFSELFAGPEIATIEKQLRRLQNRLGRFNDLSVRQRSLLAYWKGRHGKGEASGAAALSLGGLIAILHRDQEAERAGVHAALAEFASAPVAALFAAAFKPSEFAAGPEVVP